MLGPTAAGKSQVAEAIARRWDAEIVSVDSMQVFRGMDIGTAKPDPATRRRFSYHLVDVADPSHDYTVAEFQAAGVDVLDELRSSGRPTVIAGGSGLHYRSLVDPLEFPPTDRDLRSELESTPPGDLLLELLEGDPEAGALIDLDNPRRVLRAVEIMRLTGSTPTARAASPSARAVRSYQSSRDVKAIGIDPGPELRSRIERRFDAMLAAGFVGEVEELAPHLGRTARQAVGYRELLGVVEDGVDLASARSAAIQSTAALAKRQRTYFRRDPRIRWIPWHHDPEQLVRTVTDHFGEDAGWNS